MPKHTETRLLSYTPDQLFELVIDIERYPEFLPWCSLARIRKQEEAIIVADLAIGYKIFNERFTSQVEFCRPQEIRVVYKDGPFKYLHNSWNFKEVAQNGEIFTEVDFLVDFEFKSRLLETAMRSIFTKAVFKMVNAFEQRAASLYQ